MRIMFGKINRNGRPFLDPDRNVKKNDGRLKNAHPDQLLDEIVFRDHGMKPDQKKNHVYEVVESLQKQIVQNVFKHSLTENEYQRPPSRRPLEDKFA